MAKSYGDIPTTVIGETRHITKSGTQCLCGQKWEYGTVSRLGKSTNVTWRNIESVDCEKCKELYQRRK